MYKVWCMVYEILVHRKQEAAKTRLLAADLAPRDIHIRSLGMTEFIRTEHA